jgi:hypothetical protein
MGTIMDTRMGTITDALMDTIIHTSTTIHMDKITDILTIMDTHIVTLTHTLMAIVIGDTPMVTDILTASSYQPAYTSL